MRRIHCSVAIACVVGFGCSLNTFQLLQIAMNNWRPDVKKGGAECIDGNINPVSNKELSIVNLKLLKR